MSAISEPGAPRSSPRPTARQRAIRLALTMPRWIPIRSTDHHYLYRRLPRLDRYVPIEVRGHPSLHTVAAVVGLYVSRRVFLPGLGERLFGSDLWLSTGRVPPCDAVYSYGFFPRRELAQPILWEQTFGAAAWGTDPATWSLRLRRERLRIVERAARVFTATEHSAEVFRDAFPAHASKVAVVPYFLPALEPVQPEAVRRKFADARGKLHLLFLGKQARRKGLDTLVSALGRLPSACRAKLHLTVVSAFLDGRVRLPSDVEHHRSVPDVRPLFERTHLFVFPTKTEAYGLVLPEAMAAGCAVVTSSNPLQISIVGQDGGAFVNPHDPDALAEAIERLAADRDRLAEMAVANCRRAAACYAPAVVAERFYAEACRALG